MKQEIQLSDHFSYSKLIKFILPSVGMMIFTSIYGVVDGLFVSNFVGKTPFAAINLVYPLIMILVGSTTLRLSVIILPEIFELDGVWFSIILAELLSALVTAIFLIAKRKRYNY